MCVFSIWVVVFGGLSVCVVRCVVAYGELWVVWFFWVVIVGVVHGVPRGD